MSYATPAQLLQRFDARTIGDCVNDAGTRVDPTALLTDPIVQAHLDQASGEIEAALLMGGRYELIDLTGLTGNAAMFLVALCCDIAFASLWRRRVWDADDRGKAVGDSAKAELERMRRGEHIFGIDKVIDAGKAFIGGPSRVELRRLNMIVDQCRNRFYPERRTPNDR